MGHDTESSGVEFEEDILQRPRSVRYETPRMIRWVIKQSGGYIANEQQAKYLLLGFVVVASVLSTILIFMNWSGDSRNVIVPPGVFDPTMPGPFYD